MRIPVGLCFEPKESFSAKSADIIFTDEPVSIISLVLTPFALTGTVSSWFSHIVHTGRPGWPPKPGRSGFPHQNLAHPVGRGVLAAAPRLCTVGGTGDRHGRGADNTGTAGGRRRRVMFSGATAWGADALAPRSLLCARSEPQSTPKWPSAPCCPHSHPAAEHAVRLRRVGVHGCIPVALLVVPAAIAVHGYGPAGWQAGGGPEARAMRAAWLMR